MLKKLNVAEVICISKRTLTSDPSSVFAFTARLYSWSASFEHLITKQSVAQFSSQQYTTANNIIYGTNTLQDIVTPKYCKRSHVNLFMTYFSEWHKNSCPSIGKM